MIHTGLFKPEVRGLPQSLRDSSLKEGANVHTYASTNDRRSRGPQASCFYDGKALPAPQRGISRYFFSASRYQGALVGVTARSASVWATFW